MEARVDRGKIISHILDMFAGFTPEIQQALATGYCLGLIESTTEGEKHDQRADH